MFPAHQFNRWHQPPVMALDITPNEQTGRVTLRAHREGATYGADDYVEVSIHLQALAEYLRPRATRAVSRKARAVSGCVQLRLKDPNDPSRYVMGRFADGTPFWLGLSWSICNPAESALAARAWKQRTSSAMAGAIQAFRAKFI
jgi:hypothetical protein